MQHLVFAACLLAMPLSAQTSVVEAAQAALDRNDPHAALALLQPEEARDPDNAKIHYLLGVAFGDLAENANAFRRLSLARHTRAEFERAVAIDPNDLDARWALVQYYALAPGYLGGSEQKAEQQAEEINKRDPSFGKRAYDFLAHKKSSP